MKYWTTTDREMMQKCGDKMKVLLSIKPEYTDKIFDGTKRYEYRRVIFKRKEIKMVVIYATAPVQKIIGEFEIGFIIKETISALWYLTRDLSGMSKEQFFKYFANKEYGYAISIKEAMKYHTPLSIKTRPPQSFKYWTGEIE